MLSNKYSATYFRIIENALGRALEFGEGHHIIPISLGGEKNKSNVAKLTLKEHFVCHLLLTKMTEGGDLQKMSAAFVLMSGRHRGKLPTSKLYEKARRELSERTKKQWEDPDHREKVTAKMKQYGKAKVDAGWVPPWKGKARSEENRKNIGDMQRGKAKSEDHRVKHRRPCEIFGAQYETLELAWKATRDEHKLSIKHMTEHASFKWLKGVGPNELERRAKISASMKAARNKKL